MPISGELSYKYGRVYVWVQPDASLGPGVWRLSSPDELAGPSGILYDFDGESPVDITTTPATSSTPSLVTTSLDFVQLASRTT